MAMIWIIGNKGMLGTEVEILFKSSGQRCYGTDLNTDITKMMGLRKYAATHNFEWIINCSGYTNVEKAEEECDKAFGLNADGVLNIARIAQEINAKLIHISTDYVFDGNKNGAYIESDIPNPEGVYGRSKLEGEINIIKTLSQYFILRTAWLYGVYGNNFVNTMLRLFNERKTVKVVSDQWGSPTYTKNLAQSILRIIQKRSSEYGIYHTTNKGKTNWYDFAKAIYKSSRYYGLCNREVHLIPILSKDYPTNTTRPKNSYLSTSKFEHTFGNPIPSWQEGLKSFFEERVHTRRDPI
jgi:dTDP-4-dehydrorhamnose reductase